MATKTYSPDQVTVVVNGVILTGYADGTFITVSRDEDSFMKKVGADGEVARTANANRSGTLVLTLLQSSSGNDALSAMLLADETSRSGIGAIIIKDNSGTTIAAGADAWIKKLANAEFGKELGSREWTIDVGRLDLFLGGNN